MKFKAAFIAKSKNPLEVEDIALGEKIGTGQVLVRITRSGICGAQLNEIDAVKGVDNFLPHLLGHEGYGEVIEVGDGVSKVSGGESVILHWRPSSGIEAKPYTYLFTGGKLNSGLVTTFSQYSVISENRLTIVSGLENFSHSPLFGCGLTTSFMSLRRDLQLMPGERVLILGIGGVGSLSILASAFYGASHITAVDKFEEKRNLSLSLGADEYFADLEKVSGISSKNSVPYDLVIDTTGNGSLIGKAFDLLSTNGRLLLLGVMPYHDRLSINTLSLNLGRLIIASKGGSTLPDVDIPRLASLISNKKLNLDNLPFQEWKLEDINEPIGRIRTLTLEKQYILPWAN